MFDKSKFAQILKNINETYNSQRDFAKKSEINRTYLSQYMNMKLDEPPKPKTLQKLADASNGIISYEDLMMICGYIDSSNLNDINNKLIPLYEELNELEKKYHDGKKNLTLKENQIAHDLFSQVLKCLYEFKQTPETFNPDEISKDINYVSDKTRQKISKALQDDFEYFYYKKELEQKISELKKQSFKQHSFRTIPHITKVNYENSFYMCPVYGQISAGQPNWAEENIEGRIPIDTNLMNIVNPEEHFFLRVNGESMNKIIKNGAFALIHKQDVVENGEIAVVLVNGFDATLKKFTKQGDLIILEPQSNDESFETQVYDKNTSIKILGKYVGKMEINK